MNLDDLKVIWNEEEKQPMYVLDRKAVHASVSKQTTSVQCMTDVFDYVHIGVLLFVSFVPVAKRFLTSSYLDWLDWVTIVAMPLVGIVAAGVLVRVRWKRQLQESSFSQNVVGDLDKAIFQIDYKRLRFKRFPLWFGLPCALILLLNLTKTEFRFADLGGKNVIVSALSFALAILICYVAMWWEKRVIVGSLKQSLVSIREKLVNESQ